MCRHTGQPDVVAHSFGAWIVRHRRPVARVTLALALVAIPGIRRLEFTDNISIFFGPDNRQFEAVEKVRDTFGRSETLFYTLAPHEGDVFSPVFLAVLEELAQAAEHLPYATHAHTFMRTPVIREADHGLVIENRLATPEVTSSVRAETLRGTVLGDPMLRHYLVAPDGRAASIFVGLAIPSTVEQTPGNVVHAALALRDEFRARHPAITLHVTGELLFAHAFMRTGLRDLRLLGPPMFLVMCLLIGLVLRSTTGVLATVTVMSLAVGSAMGVAGWAGIRLSILSAGAAGLIFTLAVADCVHIVRSVFMFMRDGSPRADAIVRAMNVNLRPVFLTSLTTAIGFLSLNVVDSPPFRDLGNIIAIGVALAFAFSVTLLPALLAILPTRASPGQHDAVRAMMRRLAVMTARYERRIRYAVLIVAGIASLGIARLTVDGHFQDMYSPRLELRRAADFHMQRMGVASSIVHALEAEHDGGVYEPAFIRTLDAFTAWYRHQPGVMHAVSPADTVRRIHRALHDDDPAEARIPDGRDAIAQCLLLYELASPDGLSMDNQIDPTRRVAALRVLTDRLTVNEWLALDARAREWLRRHAPPAMHGTGASPDIVWAHLTQQNVRIMYRSKLLVLGIITLMLMLALRNPLLGLISMLPNVLPLSMTFGIWGFASGTVGLAVVAVGIMTLGIVVDDTIHFLSRYDSARRADGLPPEPAVRQVIEMAGSALVTTSVALIGGFAILATSPFEMTAVLGRMSALVVALALAFDLLLLPTLLPPLERRGIINLTVRDRDDVNYPEKNRSDAH